MSGDTVTRIPSHTIEDAPEGSRPPLAGIARFSPTGNPLNLHAQMAGGVREAAVRVGRVGDMTWQRASGCGWSSEQLAEAFTCLGLTLFTAYFVSYAQTPLDLPAAPGVERAETGTAAGAGAKIPAAGRSGAEILAVGGSGTAVPADGGVARWSWCRAASSPATSRGWPGSAPACWARRCR